MSVRIRKVDRSSPVLATLWPLCFTQDSNALARQLVGPFFDVFSALDSQAEVGPELSGRPLSFLDGTLCKSMPRDQPPVVRQVDVLVSCSALKDEEVRLTEGESRHSLCVEVGSQP